MEAHIGFCELTMEVFLVVLGFGEVGDGVDGGDPGVLDWEKYSGGDLEFYYWAFILKITFEFIALQISRIE